MVLKQRSDGSTLIMAVIHNMALFITAALSLGLIEEFANRPVPGASGDLWAFKQSVSLDCSQSYLTFDIF